MTGYQLPKMTDSQAHSTLSVVLEYAEKCSTDPTEQDAKVRAAYRDAAFSLRSARMTSCDRRSVEGALDSIDTALSRARTDEEVYAYQAIIDYLFDLIPKFPAESHVQAAYDEYGEV